MGKRKPRDAADEADGLDEETRLARAVEKAREATKRRNASLFAESALPGAGRRPEANYGDRWEVEEALATVAGGAEVAATLGMAHPDLEPRSAGDPSVDPAAVPDADLDPAERGYHDPEPGELWVKTLDLESGEPYYFNPRTRETTWDEPQPSSRVQIDERVAEAEADARATTPTTRETNEENDENENARRRRGRRCSPRRHSPRTVAGDRDPNPKRKPTPQTPRATKHHRRRGTSVGDGGRASRGGTGFRGGSVRRRYRGRLGGASGGGGGGGGGGGRGRDIRTHRYESRDPNRHSRRFEFRVGVGGGRRPRAREHGGRRLDRRRTRARFGPFESEPRWLYLDDTGAWQGPFSRAQLRAWRAMLPMDLVVADTLDDYSTRSTGSGSPRRERRIVVETDAVDDDARARVG